MAAKVAADFIDDYFTLQILRVRDPNRFCVTSWSRGLLLSVVGVVHVCAECSRAIRQTAVTRPVTSTQRHLWT